MPRWFGALANQERQADRTASIDAHGERGPIQYFPIKFSIAAHPLF
jgi:hypothetical protein